MSTTDQLNSTTAHAFVADNSNDWATWRLRAGAQYLRPDALKCVEHLRAACADEARANRERTARTIAALRGKDPAAGAVESTRRARRLLRGRHGLARASS